MEWTRLTCIPQLQGTRTTFVEEEEEEEEEEERPDDSSSRSIYFLAGQTCTTYYVRTT